MTKPIDAILKFACPLILGMFIVPALANEASIHLQTLKTHSRLTFKVDEGVQPVWKESQTGFEIFFPGVALNDLGAPVGSEKEWLRELGNVSDARLSSLKFDENPKGLRVTGVWNFTVGENAPAHRKMEHFDYHEKSPPRYIIDFWVHPGPTVAEVRAAKKKSDKLAEIQRAEKKAQLRRDRRLATDAAKSEAEDLTKFCRLPMSNERNVFLPFSVLHQPVNFARWFSATTPDSDYIYLEPKGDGRDAQYVRLALRLYRQGNPALAVKTLDFFDSEHPTSPFRLEMKFLRANALIKLGFAQEAIRLLNDLIATARDTGVALHSGMYVAAKTFSHNDNLAAVERFLWLMTKYPSHRLNWVFHLGAAEALYALKQTDRAAKEYQWILLHSPDKNSQAEAASRIGDLYLSRQQYERALASYFQAIDHFKEEIKNFPATFVNRGESLYWLGEFDRAAEAFTGFLENYPNHPAGWRAALRLAEIYGRKEGQSNQEKSRYWFYETINRYPLSPGATIARVNLIPCGDHGGFDALSAENFFNNEATKFDGGGEILTAQYPEFRALNHVRALLTLGHEKRAVDTAIAQLKEMGGSEKRQLIAEFLAKLVRKTVLAMLNENKKYEAIKFYQEKSKVALVGDALTESADPDYLLKLSQAASDLGLGEIATKFATFYEASDSKRRSIASDENDIQEQVVQSERHFTKAKALWIKSGLSEEEKIREELTKVLDESEYSYQKEVILGLIDEKQGRLASALSHASKANLLLPANLAVSDVGDSIRLEYWLATLQIKAGSSQLAIDILRKLRAKTQKQDPIKYEVAGPLGLPPAPTLAALLMTEGEIHAERGKWGEAASTYEIAVDKGLGGNHALYEYARVLNLTGELKNNQKAKGMLKKLADSKVDDFWRKLARESLAAEETDISKLKAKEGK